MIGFLFTAIVLCWVMCFAQGYRLFYLFRQKHPDVARKEIACAFEIYAHPEKIFYFYRKENKDFLKSDNEVWRLREQVKVLMFLSLLLPVALGLAGFILALTTK